MNPNDSVFEWPVQYKDTPDGPLVASQEILKRVISKFPGSCERLGPGSDGKLLRFEIMVNGFEFKGDISFELGYLVYHGRRTRLAFNTALRIRGLIKEISEAYFEEHNVSPRVA